MKHYYIVLLLIFFSCQLFDKESKPKEIYGCMDSTATNYNPDATIDDGSCCFCKGGISFILTSKDGGNNWTVSCIKDTIGPIVDISVVDSNNVWLCTYANAWTSIAQILYTSDGGKTWEDQHSFDNELLGQVSYGFVRMFDLNNGIAFASQYRNDGMSIVLKTSNGGNEWVKVTSSAPGLPGRDWRQIDFYNENLGFYLNTLVAPNILYKTTNSGTSWEEIQLEENTFVLKFYDDAIGLMAGIDKIHRTTDGGESWDAIGNANTIWANDIEFNPNDPSKVWLLSDSLYFSSDTGSTWRGCFECDDNGFDAISYSNSSLWVFNGKRYLLKVDSNDCSEYVEYQLPEYPYGDLILGNDFDVVDDVIVIPGFFAE